MNAIVVGVPAAAAATSVYFCRFFLFIQMNNNRKNGWRNVWIVFQILNFECKISFWRSILFIFEKREKTFELNEWKCHEYYSYISFLSSRHHKPSAAPTPPPPPPPAVTAADVISKFWMLNPFTMSNTHITHPNSINVKWLDMRAHNSSRVAHIFVLNSFRKPYTYSNNNKWICRYYILFLFNIFCVCAVQWSSKSLKREEGGRRE